MNSVFLTGRLTNDPDVRVSENRTDMAIARFTLAVDRKGAKDGQPTADFIKCTAFGKLAEHVDKYWHKGMKMIARGHILTGSYTNKDGQKVYTTDVAIDEIEFAERKSDSATTSNDIPQTPNNGVPNFANNGFLDIPSGIECDLPFAMPNR